MKVVARGVRVMLALALAGFAASTGASSDVDYAFLPVPTSRADAAKPVPPVPKYQFMFGAPARWLGPLRWRYNHTGAPAPFDGDPAGTLAQVTAALDSWTQVCGITYVYEGETTIAPDTRHPQFASQPDEINVVGWGTLDGSTAGIAHVWYEQQPRQLVDSDITLSIQLVQSQPSMRRTATHEWGHALGISHSNVGGALMSGPPDTQYNSLATLQTDDIRGCRCLYGASATAPAGFSCSLPQQIDLGAVAVNGASAPRAVTLTNNGNAPLTLNSIGINSLRVTRDNGCPAGTTLAPGQGCSVTIVARPGQVFTFTDTMTFSTSDGAYVIPVTYSGTDAPSVAAPVVQLVEYFHQGFGHYFITHLVDEIVKLDNGTFAGWTRTGRAISAWTSATAGSVPVCRFFSATFAPKSSHFYTSFAPECQAVKGDANWSFEGEVFHVALPAQDGSCSAGTQPVYRLYNNGASGAPNHRFTTDAALRAQLVSQGWVPEGAGQGVTMCAPI